MTQAKMIGKFLLANGWSLEPSEGEGDEYTHYWKNDSVGVDIGEDEVVVIDDTGDFAHIVLDYYAVIGFFYVHRIIDMIIPCLAESEAAHE